MHQTLEKVFIEDVFFVIDIFENINIQIVFAYSDEGLKVGQRRSKRQARYEPHKATCPASRSSKQVCCSNIKTETIVQEKCSDSAGYECLPITKCDLKEPVAQAESESEVLDIRG